MEEVVNERLLAFVINMYLSNDYIDQVREVVLALGVEHGCVGD